MPGYVLFSPLGMTDPSRGFRDGAFIHICRFYKPKKAYLYMSAEICAFDKQDNRYEIYLNKLCEKLGFSCEVEKIMRPELVDVSDFEAFYEDFTKQLDIISRENPDDEILLNLSSGTPQMKSALRIVCSLSTRKAVPIQVLSPVRKSNLEPPVDGNYDLELEWELNEDNTEPVPHNRCTVVKSKNFNAVLKKDIILKHIAVYDYTAALTVAKTIKDFLNEKTLKLLEAGQQRIAINTGYASMLANQVGYDLLPIKEQGNTSQAVVAFEYLLTLKIKQERGALADFTRAVSPLLTDIFELYLVKKCGLNMDSYCIKNQGGRRLIRDRLTQELKQILDSSFGGYYRDTELCAANLVPIIMAKGEDRAKIIADNLRLFEQKARNIAAHEIVSVSESWLKEKTGFDSAAILKMLEEFYSLSVNTPRYAWNSYDELNHAIQESLIL